MEKDIEILSTVIANHLFLSQFEAFRASILSLRSRNPALSLGILRTVVSRAGRFPHILWSPSCPSPSHLAFLCALELLATLQHLPQPFPSPYDLDPDLLHLKVEFLLLVQLASFRLSHDLRSSFVQLQIIPNEEENATLGVEAAGFESRPEDFSQSMAADLSTSGSDSAAVLERILDLGVRRLREDLTEDEGVSVASAFEFTDRELKWLRKVFLEQAEFFDVLCWNIQRQLDWMDPYDSGLAISVPTDVEGGAGSSTEGDDLKDLRWIQQNVQVAHLSALKECLKNGDDDAAISHLQFFHIEFGLEESEYR
ncbi:hypothetical protein ACLOJK_019849 [Asimina triloba]